MGKREKMDQWRLEMKVFSELMRYPDDAFMKRLPDVEAVVAELPGGLREPIEAFVSYVRSQSSVRLQETYTHTFYLSSKTTLNMAYHQWGNSEKRAGALARLEHFYSEAGYERCGGELPDFLPLMLEFLSIKPDVLRIEVFPECLAGLERLSAELRDTAPAYGALLSILAGIVSSQLEENRPRGHEAGKEDGMEGGDHGPHG